MLSILALQPLQKFTDENASNIGDYARASMDIYTRDLFGDGSWFTGFNCAQNGTRVDVSQGRIYLDGIGYAFTDEGGREIDLITEVPTTNLQRWVAIFAYGEIDLTNKRPTEFLTDTASRQTVSRVIAQESRRVAVVDFVSGAASPNPQYPAPNGAVVLAWVRLTNTGIAEIVRNTEKVVPSTVSLAIRAAEMDVWRRGTGAQLESLGSNISAIQQRLLDVPSTYLVRLMAQDLARLRESAKLPQVYSTYHSDSFLDRSQTNSAHIDSLMDIEEGIRFPPANERDAQIGLLNPFDGGVYTMGGMLVPAYDEVQGINNMLGANDVNQFSMAAGGFQTIDYIQNATGRQRLRVGPYYQVCTNILAYYAKGATYDALNRILTLTDGEQLQVAGDISDYQVGQAIAGSSDVHNLIRLRSVWYDNGSDEAYPNIKVAPGTVNGGVCGQTFLNQRDGYIGSVGVVYKGKGPVGDVTLMVCEVNTNGEPNLDKVIGQTVMPVAEMKVGFDVSYFHFSPPVFVQKGKMYAFVLVTVGNHIIQRCAQSNLLVGTFFSSNDGRWLVPDQNYDLSIQVLYAKFKQNRVVTELNPLELNGGMTAIDVLAQMLVPAGTKMTMECMFNGAWTDISTLRDPTTNPLNGLPPLLKFRAVFTGTADIMPTLGVGPNSRVTTKRPQPNFKHESVVYTPPSPVKTISVETRLENWDAVAHTCATKIRTGTGYNTFAAPTGVTDRAAPEDPKAIIRTSVFVLPATVTSYMIETAGTTNNVVNTFHVATRVDVATNP